MCSFVVLLMGVMVVCSFLFRIVVCISHLKAFYENKSAHPTTTWLENVSLNYIIFYNIKMKTIATKNGSVSIIVKWPILLNHK